MAAEKLAKRAAAEAEWATYPPGKQLCTAIQYNRFDLVKQVIESGRVDITESVDQCWFPLGEAVAKNAFDITEYLLVKRAPKTARAPIMNALISAMDMAAANADDRTELMALLKRYGATPYDGLEENLAGADVNRRGLNFQSVLAYADRREQRAGGKKKERATAIVEYLKSKGATYSDKDRR